jgi:hypothetical protein
MLTEPYLITSCIRSNLRECIAIFNWVFIEEFMQKITVTITIMVGISGLNLTGENVEGIKHRINFP